MKKVLYILFVVLVLVSCKTKKEKTEEESIERFNKTVAEIKEKHKVSNEKIVETKESVEEVEDNTVEERFYYFGKRFIDDSNLNPDYKCGNGMILYSKKENGSQIVIRKCEIKDISIGDLLRLQNRFIYESNSFGHEIGMLNDNDIVDVEEVCTVAYINQTSELWYKIKTNNIEGWINIDYSTYDDPYYNNRYEIIDKIHTSRDWTVRKMEQDIIVTEKLNVRDKPGLEGEKIFLLHDFEEGTQSPFVSYTIKAMTEETDVIDGIEDHWLLVEYERKKYGWIFGGYASVERGGPKYYIPEKIVKFSLSWY